MRKIIIVLVLLALPLVCFADTIVLKSGKTVEGEIIEKTDKYVKINFQGVDLTYFLDEIHQIDGVAVVPLLKDDTDMKTGKSITDNSSASAIQSKPVSTKKDISLVPLKKEVPQIKDNAEISLENLEEAIVISANVNQIKLKRGAYVDTLKKEKVIKDKKYIVEDVFSLSKPYEPAPYQAFSAAFAIIPEDDAAVLRYWKLTGGKAGYNLEVKSMDEANQMMADDEHVNQVRVSIQVLPADAEVKETSKRIKQGDVIWLSGIQFKQIEEKKDNVKQPFCPGWDATRIYYVSQLTLER